VASKILRFSEILKAKAEHPGIQTGCLVDTSILFAATYDLDEFNTSAVEVFEYLNRNSTADECQHSRRVH